MKISVVFATHKRSELLKKTLQGLADADTQGLDWEVIVVDNNGEGEAQWVAHAFAGKLPLKYLIEKRPGKNHALNTALDHTSGELIIFTDDDVIPDRGWIKNLVAAAGRWPEADIFGGRILPLFPHGHPLPFLDHEFMEGAYVIADWGFPEGAISYGRIWGPNMMVRRRLFDGGMRFNPLIGPRGSNYIMGGETEFCARAAAAGCKTIHVPSAIVHHHIQPEQLSLPWLCQRAFRYGRSIAALQPNNAKRMFNIPRYLIRQMLVAYGCYLLAWLGRDRAKKIACGIEYYRHRGNIYQHYLSGKKSRGL